ncbi:hypothetical protein MGG_16102 [Pyricularia oryzae 70-15]|uniref:Uncharacterized protein n=1 Tax=Pyricularia oryzae (strain 70-15 / ATCC MYA-4617 / FGSC 8958) TaxID=242507 RepID=G4MQM0_PYRO7|nr:uncharacterized protein MGG_16102 [Pyricularia oryzae 70-15]EHA56510.1 hypothetical protein MGG_16102 [Pyricularia oryzae 70-15]
MRKRHESGGRPRGDTRDKLKTLTAYVDQALEGGNNHVRIRPLDLPSESREDQAPRPTLRITTRLHTEPGIGQGSTTSGFKRVS